VSTYKWQNIFVLFSSQPSQVATLQYGARKFQKSSTLWVENANVTDRQKTDGTVIVNI